MQVYFYCSDTNSYMLMYLPLSFVQCVFREKDTNCDGISILLSEHMDAVRHLGTVVFLLSLLLGSKG